MPPIRSKKNFKEFLAYLLHFLLCNIFWRSFYPAEFLQISWHICGPFELFSSENAMSLEASSFHLHRFMHSRSVTPVTTSKVAPPSLFLPGLRHPVESWSTEKRNQEFAKLEHSSFKVFLTRGPCCRALMDHRNHHKDQKPNIHFAFAACGVFLYWPWMQFCSKISHFRDACRPQSGPTEPHQLNFLAQWVPTMSCT